MGEELAMTRAEEVFEAWWKKWSSKPRKNSICTDIYDGAYVGWLAAWRARGERDQKIAQRHGCDSEDCVDAEGRHCDVCPLTIATAIAQEG